MKQVNEYVNLGNNHYKTESYTDFVSGLGKEIWESVGGKYYIRQERDKWGEKKSE